MLWARLLSIGLLLVVVAALATGNRSSGQSCATTYAGPDGVGTYAAPPCGQ